MLGWGAQLLRRWNHESLSVWLDLDQRSETSIQNTGGTIDGLESAVPRACIGGTCDSLEIDDSQNLILAGSFPFWKLISSRC